MIVGGYIAVIVITIGASSKFISVGPWVLNGATLIWPLTFVFNDIFTEVYGYKRSRRIIWTGIAVQVMTAFAYWLVGAVPGAPFWHEQKAFDTILGQAPRIVFACILAYCLGEYANSVTISKLKYLQGGRRGTAQGLRFVASTAIGEFFDTLVFFPIAFVGVVPLVDLLRTMGCVYLAKIVYEILALPGSMWLANFVKAQEGLDVIDNPATTDYSPMLSLSD
jgi:queuosine precursor transporter